MLCLPSAVFIALMLVGPSKDSKWRQIKPVGYLQAWSRICTRDYSEQIQLVVRAGLELGASESQVQRSNRSTTLPPFPKFSLNLPSFDNCKTSHRSMMELHYICNAQRVINYMATYRDAQSCMISKFDQQSGTDLHT